MRLPWQRQQDDTPRREIRENSPFTDAVIAGILAASQGTQPGNAAALGALETAAGLYARAFAGAKVTPVTPVTEAITSSVLALIGRELVRRGETVLAIKIVGGGLALIPAGTWDVRGGWAEPDWTYRVDIFGASEHMTELLPSPGVVHPRYAVDPARPWLGVAPLHWARLTGTLAANLETRLGEEAGAAVGSFLPVPDQQDGGSDDDDDTPDALALLRADIRAAKGRQLLVETTAAGWGTGAGGAPRADWKPSRFGADPPESVVDLMGKSALAVLNACGVPVSLATDADGTSQRESWRRFVMGTVEPVAALVVEELARKLDTPALALDFSGLWAHDLAGRAQSFKALVTGGMEIDKAAQLSGLIVE